MILRKPQNRDRLLRLLDAEILRSEAQAQIEQAELRFRAEEGERASFESENAKCAKDIFHWWDRWLWTYDPRLVGTKTGPYVPFKLYPKQKEMVRWLNKLILGQEPGLLEKSRDAGATYICVGVCLWHWLYTPGFKATFGSRGEDLVDNLNDPDSIFEKMRIMLRRLPSWMLPDGFDGRKHDNIMLLLNPATGATITGEGGDQMGRGGRSTVYLVDEGAFISRPKRVERALAGNADCVVWLSTVNPEEGLGNFFAMKRHSGQYQPHQLFRLHWRDDKRKDDAWAKKKRATMDSDTWEAEYEINYSAGSSGLVIQGDWVRSAMMLSTLEGDLPRLGRGVSGGDVGGGKAKSVVVHRYGPIVLPVDRRDDPDTTDTAFWMMECCAKAGTRTLNFDAVAIGQGVLSTLSKAEYADDPKLKKIARTLSRRAVNTGEPPSTRLWPDDRMSEDMFVNLKAEVWWLARGAFQRTHEHVRALLGDPKGILHPLDELIALPDDQILAGQLSLPKWFRNEKGKIIIEKKEQLQKRGIPSPDEADAFVLTFLEAEDDGTGMEIDADALHRPNPWAFGGRDTD